MNWLPLSKLKISSISQTIAYNDGKIKTKVLYEQLQKIPIPLEDKVKFILMHWGWDGVLHEEALERLREIKLSGFVMPQNVVDLLKQLYGLRIPIKTQDPYDKYGGTLVFEFLKKWENMVSSSEFLSMKYDDNIMPIGYILNYNGRTNQLVSGWENPNYQSTGYERYDLYHGSSGRVYFEFVDGDCVGLKGESLDDFFEKSFGLIPFKEDVVEELTGDDMGLIEHIDELYDQGAYKQNYFRR